MKEEIKQRLKYARQTLRDFYWRFYGISYKHAQLPNNPSSFLFVCKGNICRSPFAERRAAKIAEDNSLKDREFYSVGLDVAQSLPSPQQAIAAAERFGVKLNGHRSHKITKQRLTSADMIITMEAMHFSRMRKTYPHLRDKIYLLPLFENQSGKALCGYSRYNIIDPYGKSLDQFHDCYERIESCLKALFAQIK